MTIFAHFCIDRLTHGDLLLTPPRPRGVNYVYETLIDTSLLSWPDLINNSHLLNKVWTSRKITTWNIIPSIIDKTVLHQNFLTDLFTSRFTRFFARALKLFIYLYFNIPGFREPIYWTAIKNRKNVAFHEFQGTPNIGKAFERMPS